jgi:hypothetical protein
LASACAEHSFDFADFSGEAAFLPIAVEGIRGRSRAFATLAGRALNLTMPPAMLTNADEVIE